MINRQQLPSCAMIDTNVYMLAMGDRPKHQFAGACREFVEEMVQCGRELLISPFTLAEYLRGQVTSRHLTPNIRVVSFDDRCGRFLGSKFPAAQFNDVSKMAGYHDGHFQYDALIIACAKVWGADVLVSLDGTSPLDPDNLKKMAKLAEIAGVVARHPMFYRIETPYFLRRGSETDASPSEER